jgi:ubiquinone/menaquinone biosynthesis C-methylase UbiE
VKKPGVPKADYSQIAKYYDKVRPAPADILLSKIIEYGKIDANCAVLDIGCGTGRYPLSISAMKNLTFCALEPSIEMLKQAVAKDKSKCILWVRGDGQRLPFQDGLFDCVYITAVIHHIENKEVALREIYRVTKKDGKCVIMTFSHSRIKKHITHYFPGVVAIDLKRVPSVLSLKKMMTTMGFRNVHYHAVQVDEGYVFTEEYLRRVRNKYMSTLTLLSEEDFQRGFKIFKERVENKYGNQIRKISWFVFIDGLK